MTRKLLLFALAVLLIAPSVFAQCNLAMTVTCTARDAHGRSTCTSTTTNNGSGTCSGQFIAGWFANVPQDQVKLEAFTNSLGLDEFCVDTSFFPPTHPQVIWACMGEASLGAGQSFTSSVVVFGSNPNPPLVAITSIADADAFAYAFTNFATPTCVPSISAPPVTQSGVSYSVSWTAVSDPTAQYIIEESGSADFSGNVTQRQVSGTSATFRHDNMATTTTYYYRVRATHCNGSDGQFSAVASTVVQAPAPQSSRNPEAVVPFGSTDPVSIQVFIPGDRGKDAFDSTYTASTDKPFLTVTPPSGLLPATGTTVTVTANPANLPPGASTGTLTIAANGKTSQIPVSISLATPVSPIGKTTPPSNALVIPVVTHVNGAAGPFLSDVRLTNGSNNAINYQVTMTPTRTDATKASKATQISVGPGDTIALNDIAKNFFGFGATGGAQDVGFGSLEIRPLNSASLATFASSRTYASTARGTFGQFIAAMPFSNFATKRQLFPIPGLGGGTITTSPLLSLQQVAESAKFRTNVGIVEGAGEPASGVIRIRDVNGSILKQVDFSLQPGEHKQMNRFIAVDGGIASLDDGRIEIEVTSETGAVTAYASVLDNLTTDPLAVMPVDATRVKARRYVLPGMAELNNGPASNFHSDVRVFNGSTSDATVTATFYPQGNGAPVSAQAFTLRAGEVKVLDNILPSFFKVSSGGGSVLFATEGESSLVATGRTYSIDTAGGTYGQFIPGVTPTEGIGLGDRALQVLQLEQSQSFRTNLGLAEVSGNRVTVKVTLHLPDSKATPFVEVTLEPNEFRQLGRVIESMASGSTYNARISIEVIAGTGRVTAYGSVVDNATVDPTYVPAQ